MIQYVTFKNPQTLEVPKKPNNLPKGSRFHSASQKGHQQSFYGPGTMRYGGKLSKADVFSLVTCQVQEILR